MFAAHGCNNNWRLIIQLTVTYSQLVDVIIIGGNHPIRSNMSTAYLDDLPPTYISAIYEL